MRLTDDRIITIKLTRVDTVLHWDAIRFSSKSVGCFHCIKLRSKRRHVGPISYILT